MIKVKYDSTIRKMTLDQLVHFTNGIEVWKNYTKDMFLDRITEDVPEYELDTVEFKLETNRPSCNIFWKKKCKEPTFISRYFNI
jgi:hypothetical protein